MAWSDTPNCHHRTTIIIDTFDDGTEHLFRHEREYIQPPCANGCGCRAMDPEWEACEYDPKTGLCAGRMA